MFESLIKKIGFEIGIGAQELQNIIQRNNVDLTDREKAVFILAFALGRLNSNGK